MLSENLTALRGHLTTYRESGVELRPEAVAHLVLILDSMAEDARALEAHAVRQGEIHAVHRDSADAVHRDGVKVLRPDFRRRAGTDQGADGGDAA